MLPRYMLLRVCVSLRLLDLNLAWLTNKIISFEIAVLYNKIISILQYDITKSFNKRINDCNCVRPRDTLIFFQNEIVNNAN